MYCLKCRKKTDTINPKHKKTKNNRLLLTGRCAVCNSIKSQFIAGKTAGFSTGAGLFSKYKGEKHIPKYNYCGPGTRLDKRLNKDLTPKLGELPINRVDAACLEHDKAYQNNPSLVDRHKADVQLIQNLNSIKNPTLGERFGRTVAKNAMKGKILLNI